MSESGADFLHRLGDDASKWADGFLKRYPSCGVPHDELLGWFANAIEHSFDIRAGRIHNGDHAEWLLNRPPS